MSQLKIYRASAGSGKTYTLSGEFIKLLFQDPQSYKAILAVTFTNKATGEMKNRILENLNALATAPNPDFLQDLMECTGKKEAAIRNLAKVLLINILNDFSKFSINTIDSFFQKVIRAFAFEAGLPAGFKVELDTDRVLNRAVDDLMREIELRGNEELKEWLIKHTLSKIEEGRDWNIISELTSLGREVFKEEFQSLRPEVLEKLKDKKLLERYRQKLFKLVKQFEDTIQIEAQRGLELMQKHHVSWEILKGKSRSPLKKFEKLKTIKKSTDIHEVTALAGLIDNPDDCLRKDYTESEKAMVLTCYSDGLNDVLVKLVTTYTNDKTTYFTAKAILGNLNALGITTDIALKVREIALNENLFLLADANRLLYRIIDENEAPFIYEKIGSRFNHYMIDEFQDTSKLQWDNFRPLILNSISENNTALLVGDVKQSIYRWRNSDWKLLSEQVHRDFSLYGTDDRTLDTNWRSFENVITFNNVVFKGAAAALQTEFIGSSEANNPTQTIPEGLRSRIVNAYNDTVQKVAGKSLGTGGYVHVGLLEGENKADFMANATEEAVQQIEKLLAAGYAYQDICVLVRRKSEGQQITEALLSGIYSTTGQKHPVISNETLLLGNSPAVNLVLQQIKFIQDPENEVHKAYIKLYAQFYETSASFKQPSCETSPLLDDDATDAFQKLKEQLLELKGQPLFEMTEALVRALPDELYSHQFVFLQGLLDAVRDYSANQSVNIHDFIEWWDDKGQTTSISVPEGQNAINVMTIHKSKGLEFKAVIIPYCNWPLDEKGHTSMIWCHPLTEPFNELDLIPVNYSQQLLHTAFVEEYLDERLHQFVDNLNLLYVAFTRARESLVVLGETPAKNGNLKNVSHLLFHLLSQIHKCLPESEKHREEEFSNGWDNEELTYTFGKIVAQSSEKTNHDSSSDITFFKTTDPGERVKIHPESEAMCSPDAMKHIKHGKVMHNLFELIKYTDNVDAAITQLVLNGQLKTKEKEEVAAFVNQLINRPDVREWFDATNQVINEGNILLRTGSYRPDRVIINQSKTIVVDYKFGELRNEKHHEQVRMYMGLLKQMGYGNIEGYLWYLGENESIEPVQSQPLQGRLFE